MELYEGDAQRLEGELVRIFFRNEESGFTAGLFAPGDGARKVRVSGPLGGLREHQPCILHGRFENHPRYGLQFVVESCEIKRPEGAEAVRAYLASGLIKGVGPKLAERIVRRLGARALERIEEDPAVLTRVPGIGTKKAREIVEALRAQSALREVVLFLAAHGLPPALAGRLVDAYGKDAARLLQADPYRLTEDVAGIGFKRADEIARKLGLPEDAPRRLQAAILHALATAVRQEGHTCLPRRTLLDAAAGLLGLPVEILEPELDHLAESGRVTVERPPGVPPSAGDDELVWPAALFAAETGLAAAVAAHLGAGLDLRVRDPQALVAAWERTAGLELTAGQRHALAFALQQPLTVVTGGPGVGKTTILKALTDIAGEHGWKLALAAPTGRAAKRLAEATGRPAVTLHRLLEFQPGTGRFLRGRDDPLDAELIIVDEVSMLDLPLAHRLLEATPSGSALVLVGDADQLPSVGPGRVLADLITSGVVPVARLTEIFRQAEGSLIVRNAHRILAGLPPEKPETGGPGADFFFLEREDPEAALELLLDLVARRLPKAYGFDPIDDIQVLTPMYRGHLGADRVNAELGRRLNRRGEELRIGERRFRLGDKVLQIRNNYELELFNGDPGRIVGVDAEAGRLTVRFDTGVRRLAGPELQDLVPAYAITVHRAQGSEYPAVLVLLDRAHAVLLHRRLLYTAVTRARRLLVLLGSKRALARALGAGDRRHRCSGLKERLAAFCSAGPPAQTAPHPARADRDGPGNPPLR